MLFLLSQITALPLQCYLSVNLKLPRDVYIQCLCGRLMKHCILSVGCFAGTWHYNILECKTGTKNEVNLVYVYLAWDTGSQEIELIEQVTVHK